MLHIVDEPARVECLQPFSAGTLRLADALGVLDCLLPRPVTCLGINLGDMCRCDEHQAMRDARDLHGVGVKQPWDLAA